MKYLGKLPARKFPDDDVSAAETTQQPVAWIDDPHKPQPHCVTDLKFCSMADYEAGRHLLYTPLYGAPCQREPLTEALEFAAATLSSDWPERCQEIVRRARAALADPAAPTDTLCQRLQYQCSEWGAYWRAPDAHGVELSIEQATELLRVALGVEVDVKIKP